jgi:hypothetical protein
VRWNAEPAEVSAKPVSCLPTTWEEFNFSLHIPFPDPARIHLLNRPGIPGRHTPQEYAKKLLCTFPSTEDSLAMLVGVKLKLEHGAAAGHGIWHQST